jgi:hydrogenase/urease accessory protein HupE
MGRRFGIGSVILAALLGASPLAVAHTQMMTEVLVSFRQPEQVDVTIGLDLSLMLGSPERYYQLATESSDQRQKELQTIVPTVIDSLQLWVGSERLKLAFHGFSASTAHKSDYLDGSMSKLSTFEFVAALPARAVPPATDAPLKLVIPIAAPIDYPVAYTVQIPSAHLSMTRWVEEGVHESDPFVWGDKAPTGPASGVAATPRSTARSAIVDPDALPWYGQVGLYLKLGFHHIVPEGADHILFVLGLFFLGVTWRKLLSQTTVFTIAHATTLFLSAYGIFSLPSRFVEPLIAASIAFIAIENIVKPRLGWGRLAIVFGFGLIHGLGFASSLSDIPFPKRDFIVALLGFNVGVDCGQLFVIALAFLAVGWFRNERWFRRRIAIPCSCAIAAVGVYWAVDRVMYYCCGLPLWP